MGMDGDASRRGFSFSGGGGGDGSWNDGLASTWADCDTRDVDRQQCVEDMVLFLRENCKNISSGDAKVG